jgi:hypothetical protein
VARDTFTAGRAKVNHLSDKSHQNLTKKGNRYSPVIYTGLLFYATSGKASDHLAAGKAKGDQNWNYAHHGGSSELSPRKLELPD